MWILRASDGPTLFRVGCFIRCCRLNTLCWIEDICCVCWSGVFFFVGSQRKTASTEAPSNRWAFLSIFPARTRWRNLIRTGQFTQIHSWAKIHSQHNIENIICIVPLAFYSFPSLGECEISPIAICQQSKFKHTLTTEIFMTRKGRDHRRPLGKRSIRQIIFARCATREAGNVALLRRRVL